MTTTFSLKQGETRSSRGPIPHPLITSPIKERGGEREKQKTKQKSHPLLGSPHLKVTAQVLTCSSGNTTIIRYKKLVLIHQLLAIFKSVVQKLKATLILTSEFLSHFHEISYFWHVTILLSLSVNIVFINISLFIRDNHSYLIETFQRTQVIY